MSQSKYLFINKDANSETLSRSQASERKTINHHAQRRQYASRQADPLGFVNLHGPSKSVRTSVTGQKDRQSSALVGRPLSSLEHGRASTPATRQLAIPYITLHPLSSIGGDWDPFHSTTLPRGPWARTLLHYYANTSVLAHMKAEVHAQPSRKLYQEPIWLIVHDCLYSPVHFYTTAAVTATRIREIDRQDVLHGCPNVEWIVQKAIQLLRRTLTDEIETGRRLSTQTLLDIHRLYFAELFLRNYAAARIHLNIFAKLVQQVDSDSPFDNFCRETWAVGDVPMAIETLSPPLFPAACRPLTEKEYLAFLPSMDPRLGVLGSALLHYTDSRNIAMSPLVRDVLQWVRCRSAILSSSSACANDAKWLRNRGNHVMSRLLSWKSLTVSRSGCSVEAIRLTIILWLAFLTTHMASRRSGKLMLPKIKLAIFKAYPFLNDIASTHLASLEDSDTRLVIWILFTGFYAAMQCKDDKEWFTTPLVELLRSHGIANPDMMNELLSQFLFLPEFQSRSLGALMLLVSKVAE